jgi:hypothetical protein
MERALEQRRQAIHDVEWGVRDGAESFCTDDEAGARKWKEYMEAGIRQALRDKFPVDVVKRTVGRWEKVE